MLVMDSAAVPRLGIPAYHWWNECLHGVARAGKATQFPVSIAMAASWNPDLLYRVASVVGDEMRAKHQPDRDSPKHYGLTCWGPTINMARDPRWGRTEETYGEDPFLTGKLAVAFITGLQGDDPRYLKIAATPKHFAVYNQEVNREGRDVTVSERALREYYLPAFRESVVTAKASSLMTSYNGINGVPNTINTALVTDLLRNEWGFAGVVVADANANSFVKDRHRQATSYPQAAARFIKAGGSLISDTDAWRGHLLVAVQSGLLSEAELNRPLTEVLTLRFRLGQFDPPGIVPYAQIPLKVVGSPEHQRLALQMAREGIVLLKNSPLDHLKNVTKLLPLDRKKPMKIVVVGPYGDVVQLGGYSGDPANQPISPFAGILKKAGPDTHVSLVQWAKQGVDRRKGGELSPDAQKEIGESEVVIAVLGLGSRIEGESIDRKDLRLPPEQNTFLKQVYALNRRLVVVLENGGPVTDVWMNDNVPAIVELWYPGEQGGAALADVLFGDYNPAGRLPLTVYRSESQLPPMGSYEVAAGRTYQYLKEEPLFPFGHGMSYTSFDYGGLKIDSPPVKSGLTIQITLSVKNIGAHDGDEVVQLYVRHGASDKNQPLQRLSGFKRVSLTQGETRSVCFTLGANDLAVWDAQRKMFVVMPGNYEIMIGASSSDIRLRGNVQVGG